MPCWRTVSPGTGTLAALANIRLSVYAPHHGNRSWEDRIYGKGSFTGSSIRLLWASSGHKFTQKKHKNTTLNRCSRHSHRWSRYYTARIRPATQQALPWNTIIFGWDIEKIDVSCSFIWIHTVRKALSRQLAVFAWLLRRLSWRFISKKWGYSHPNIFWK